jgi:hypothetical protein
MWIRISLAPLWVRLLVFVALSVLWAGVFAAIDWYQDGTLPRSLVATIVVGVGTAAVWSAVAVSQTKQRYGRVLADVDLPATRAAALKAAFGGPIPTDPVVRQIAAILATIRAQTIGQHARRQIIAGAVLSALMAGLTIWALADGSPRRALITGVMAVWCGGAAAQTHWARRRAIQRQLILAAPDQRPATY